MNNDLCGKEYGELFGLQVLSSIGSEERLLLGVSTEFIGVVNSLSLKCRDNICDNAENHSWYFDSVLTSISNEDEYADFWGEFFTGFFIVFDAKCGYSKQLIRLSQAGLPLCQRKNV